MVSVILIHPKVICPMYIKWLVLRNLYRTGGETVVIRYFFNSNERKYCIYARKDKHIECPDNKHKFPLNTTSWAFISSKV